MKKLIIIFLAVAFYINIAQSQNVGINTTNPDEALHVIGDIILLESPDGTKKILLRTAGADGELKSLGDLFVRAQGSDIFLNHVPSDGNVGIGTITATEKLTVEGAIKLDNTSNMTSEAGTIKFETDDFLGFNGTTWESLTDGGGGVWTESGSNVYYLGSVGVNTTSPTADFHIVGDTLLFQSPDGTKNLLFRNAGADSEVKSIGDLYLRGQNSDVIINHVGSDGNVGIGTGTPMEKLDVFGGVRIGTTTSDNAGTIRFDEGDFEGYDGFIWKSLTNGGGIWTEDGNRIHYTGRVGINTTSPNADLHVVGDTLLLESPDGTKNLLFRNAGADSEVKSIGDLYIRGQGNDVIINHAIGDGNVGIGTGTPSEKLEVAGDVLINDNAEGAVLNLKSENGGGVVMFNEIDDYTGAIGWDFDEGLFIIDHEDHIILTHDGNKFNLDDKVEIDGDLELQGSSRNLLYESSLNVNSINSDSSVVMITPNTPSNGGISTLFFGEDDDANFGMGFKYDGVGNNLEIFGKSLTSIYGPHMIMDRTNGNTFFDGGVRIGGDFDFPSGYILAVDGKMICEEIQVQLTSAWPDYVFDDSYQLMPLSEVKSFIQKHNHLPGIPSAQKVAEEGISLGDMQKLLMQKVEELTLYILELEKKNIELTKQFDTHKK